MLESIPSPEIRAELRREVGFGCPVPGCANPFFTWHQFDPPAPGGDEFDPAGMIALCPRHGARAFAGGYSREELIEFKQGAAARAVQTKRQLGWMNRRLLIAAGGNFYYHPEVVVRVEGEPVLWIKRDPADYMLVNINMATKSGEARTIIEDNFLLASGDAEEIRIQPSGKLLRMAYENGDELTLNFFDIVSIDALRRRYIESQAPHWDPKRWHLAYPHTVLELGMTVAGTDIDFDPFSWKTERETRRGYFSAFRKTALDLNLD